MVPWESNNEAFGTFTSQCIHVHRLIILFAINISQPLGIGIARLNLRDNS